jgi:hypothetical protein
MSDEPSAPAELITPDLAPEGPGFWTATGRFFGTVGSALGRAAVRTGESAVAAYQAVA